MMPNAYLEGLKGLQSPDGGWGYGPDAPTQVEPTCWALLALQLERNSHAEPIRRGLSALLQWQEPDGSWRIRHGQETAVWPTALGLFALAALNAEPEARKRAAAWLVHHRNRGLDDPIAYRRDFEIDPELPGWSWTENTFAWVEPTAWACLALRHAGWEKHQRVADGHRLMLDRAMDEGGINFGNRRVFGRMLDPNPSVTGLMLLAFAGCPDEPRLQAARGYLRRMTQETDDLENLCWIRLGLATWGQADQSAALLPQLATRIEEAYRERRESRLFIPSILREAQTALALAADSANPFRWPPAIPPAPGGELPQPHTAAPKKSIGRRFRSWVQGAAVRAHDYLRTAPPESAVHIASVTGYETDLAGVVRDQFANFRERVPLKGKRVVLKPNLVEFHRGRVINTDPRVIAAVIELCRREEAAEIIVADGPGHWRNSEHLVTESGLGEVLRSFKVPFIDLNHDDIVKTPNMGQLTRLEHLFFARTIASADVLISLPKLKTHHWAGVTLSLKNMFGTLPGICYGWPKNELHWRGIENSIIDINLTRTPDLAIVDGIVGMEGDGPLCGTAKPMGVLVMGCDPLAVDATCCRLMMLDPAKVGHLGLVEFKKMGLLQEALIKQLGENIAAHAQPFETIPDFEKLHTTKRPLTLPVMVS